VTSTAAEQQISATQRHSRQPDEAAARPGGERIGATERRWKATERRTKDGSWSRCRTPQSPSIPHLDPEQPSRTGYWSRIAIEHEAGDGGPNTAERHIRVRATVCRLGRYGRTGPAVSSDRRVLGSAGVRASIVSVVSSQSPAPTPTPRDTATRHSSAASTASSRPACSKATSGSVTPTPRRPDREPLQIIRLRGILLGEALAGAARVGTNSS
jgi:hypothetical protein